MSWTNECCQSNDFKVKNMQEVKEVIEHLGFVVYINNDNTLCFYSTGEGTWFDDSAEVVLSLKPVVRKTIEEKEETVNLLGVLSDNLCNSLEELLKQYNLTDKDIMIIPIVEYLQDQLVVGTGLVVTTAGFEGRCSGDSNPFGDALFIAKTENKNICDYMSLSKWVDDKAEELNVEV